MSFTVCSALRWWSKETPHAMALSVEDQTVTFGELYAWAGRVAAHLGSLGVKPGDRVCTLGLNTLEYAILAFGLMRAGAIAAPLSFRSTATEIRDWFEDLTPSIVFADAERQPVAGQAVQGLSNIPVFSMDDVLKMREATTPATTYEPTEDMPVFIIGTSGSTAKPKGVMYTHRSVMTYASEFAICEPRCGRGSRILSVGPFSSSSGYLLLMEFVSLGATMFIESQFKADRALRLLVDQRITTFQGVPIFFERISEQPEFSDADLSTLYWTQVGGALVSQNLLKVWRDKGVVLRHVYGSTEAGGGWGARDDVAISHPEKCGRGGMFTEYAILAEDGGLAAPGVPGEILVRSACLMAGYWNNPEASRQAVKNGRLHTGDLGVIDETGNLTFIDRLKDIIISGGLNISAAEVERVISKLPGVTEVAVIAVADAAFGETPLAVVHAAPAKVPVADIIDICNQQLSNYKVPRYVAMEDEPLPRLPSGKISKRALREKYKNAASELVKVR